MRLHRATLFSFGLILATAAASYAQLPHSCKLEGRDYPENAVVCSNGLALLCVNGTWQNNDGARCDGPPGSYVGPTRPYHERNDEEIPEFYREKYPELNLPGSAVPAKP